MRYVLFTECLQNDFVAPLAPGQPLPNALHIGRAESRRVLGDPEDDWQTRGPLARFLAAWAAGAGPEHTSIHVRDWHDPLDPATRPHLAHFGAHCVQGSEGARFVGPLETVATSGGAHVVDSAILSDFVDTDLEQTLARSLDGARFWRAGIVGVWTDFKVRYLAYDLVTRTGVEEVAVCSALTASRSRIHHREALEHLASQLGVVVIDGLPAFLDWLGSRRGAVAVAPPRGRAAPLVHTPAETGVGDEERRLVEHLFRDCREVSLEGLSGGFSGSRVYRTSSLDRNGKREIPFVVKVDVHAKIARERVAVEAVENLLGAASPRLSDYVDLETLGAIKYQFATMHAGEVQTLQRRLRSATSVGEVRRLVEGVIDRVLRRLYQSPTLDRVQLFHYYDFLPRYAETTLARVSALAETETADAVHIPGLSGPFPHPARVYRRLDVLRAEEPAEVVCTWVHGDLNLANVLLDATGNTWLIDYFWTRVGHALQDLAKLENDVKFLMVPLGDDDALARAVDWDRLLMEQDDLRAEPPELPASWAHDAALARAHAAIVCLRRLGSELLGEAGCPSPVPAREYRIAQLRYAAHTLSFDECSDRQKRFALASACLLAQGVG